MPLQGKKRRGQTQDETSIKKSKKSSRNQRGIDDLLSASSRQKVSHQRLEPFVQKKCTKWFQEFAGNKDQIEPEGVEQVCKACGVEPDDIVMLVLAFNLNAQKMGFFTLDEWSKGMQKLECDSTSKLRNKLSSLRSSLDESSYFKSVYRYAFDFCKEPGQRTLDMPTAKAMLGVLLTGRWSLLGKFQLYLDNCSSRVINRDQWNNVLEFSRMISPDLTNYDMDGAWPVLLDEFVEFLQSQAEAS